MVWPGSCRRRSIRPELSRTAPSLPLHSRIFPAYGRQPATSHRRWCTLTDKPHSATTTSGARSRVQVRGPRPRAAAELRQRVKRETRVDIVVKGRKAEVSDRFRKHVLEK